MLRTLYLLSFAFCSDGPGLIEGKVITIADGDSLAILDGKNVQRRILLHGIDAPEEGQPLGTVAGDNLTDKVFGKVVRVESAVKDRYGRIMGRVYLGDRYINLEQVRDGFAWRFERFDKANELRAAEQEARQQHCGRWHEKGPISRGNGAHRSGVLTNSVGCM